jgi:hypothetical protein
MNNYRSELTEYGFKIIQTDLAITITKMSSDGEIKSEVTRPAEEVFPGMTGSRWPILTAAFDSDEKEWHIDCAAGFQRWRGYATTGQVSGMLRECNFERDEIKNLIAEGKKRDGKVTPWVDQA